MSGIGSVKQLFNALIELGGGKKTSPQLLAQLEALGHPHIQLLNCGPAHGILGLSREKLAQMRITPQDAAKMTLIRAGKLEPRLVSDSDFTPPKVLFNGKPRLLETLSQDERSALFEDHAAVWHPPEHAEVALHRGEHRAIQDYMSAAGQSRLINGFLRGEKPQNMGLKTPKDLHEFALLMISGLNALPSQSVVSMHTLPSKSPMFENMMRAARDGKPFQLDYFLSVTPLSQQQALDRHTPPNSSLGDTAILVHSNIAKDVSSVNQIYAQEKESIIPPYVSFKANAVQHPKANQPVLELIEYSRTKNDHPKPDSGLNQGQH